MTRPTVVVLCVHGEAKPHYVPTAVVMVGEPFDCPGGRVLEQAIIIERDTDGNWVGVEILLGKLSEGMVLWASATKWPIPDYKATRRMISDALDALASAQEER